MGTTDLAKPSNPRDLGIPFPTIPKILLDELDRRFPLPQPKLEWLDRKIWLELGKRAVIDFLRIEYEAQQKS